MFYVRFGARFMCVLCAFYVHFGVQEILEEKKSLEEKMKRLSNTVAAKMDDPEEDADSELEEEQDIRKYKSYFNCENVFLVISMIQAKTWTFAQYFYFHVVYWYFTQYDEFLEICQRKT